MTTITPRRERQALYRTAVVGGVRRPLRPGAKPRYQPQIQECGQQLGRGHPGYLIRDITAGVHSPNVLARGFASREAAQRWIERKRSEGRL